MTTPKPRPASTTESIKAVALSVKNCSNCGKPLGEFVMLSPTTDKKRREQCPECSTEWLKSKDLIGQKKEEFLNQKWHLESTEMVETVWQFIQQAIIEARQEREREMVEKLKNTIDGGWGWGGSDDYVQGWVDCHGDILSKLDALITNHEDKGVDKKDYKQDLMPVFVPRDPLTEYKAELREKLKDHYWDSFEADKEIVLKHIDFILSLINSDDKRE